MFGVLLALGVSSANVDAAAADDPAARTPAKVDPQARERSRAAFRKGVAQLRASDWAGARASFEEAYALVPHSSILLNLGIARLRTDDPVLAEQDLVRFLSEDSGAAPEELAGARDALGEARSKIGTLRVVLVPASARVLVDGKPIPIRPPTEPGDGAIAETRLKAGTHTLAVDADGYAAEQRSLEVPPKSEAVVRIVLQAGGPPAEPRADRPSRARAPSSRTRTIVGWSLTGLSGVALVSSAVLGIRALSLSSDYETPGTASFQDPEVKDDGITARTAADVALVVAIAAGAGAAILLLTRIGAAPTSTARRSIVPVLRALPPLLTW